MNENSPQPKRPAVNLETHRFAISPESMLLMKETREMFRQLQGKYPELVAMSFFGSRIIGKEHGASEKVFTHPVLGSSTIKTPESDLDLIIFCDETLDTLDSLYHESVPSRVVTIMDDVASFSRLLKEEKGISNRLHINGIDVSPEATKEDLTYFKIKILESISNPPLQIEFSIGAGSDSFYNLAARFLLTIGDSGKIRKEIIDDFSKDKNGEAYWSVLMETLSEFERSEYDKKTGGSSGIPGYNYPKTLAEGREYFLKEKQINNLN